jgi:hypothetical protein
MFPAVQRAGGQDRLEASRRPGRRQRILLIHREQHTVPRRYPTGRELRHYI